MKAYFFFLSPECKAYFYRELTVIIHMYVYRLYKHTKP